MTALVRSTSRHRARPRRFGRLRYHLAAGLLAAGLTALAARAVWPLTALLP
ncbi:hypothetical protein AB0B04_32230 [Streptomyces xinghaiensis]|uniref:hypothetical protein n=1 Tax=Streptomyces TaxID=1883 RepID=UPI000B1C7743|nr:MULTISPECIES: hypothetical protein [Streptomyces]